MPKTEKSRYQRQLIITSIGVSGQERLSRARVLCVGAGGLGSTVLHALAAAGTGRLGIADDDLVAETDLNRQFLYNQRDIGKSKVDIATSRLRLLNPEIEIVPHKIRISPGNSEAVISNYDYLLDCADNQPTSLLLNDWCYHLEKTLVFASISQFSGILASFSGQSGPCLRCWYRMLPERGQDCSVEGILGSVAAVFGAMQANELIKAIIYGKKIISNRLILFDTMANKLQHITIQKDKHCPACCNRHRPVDDNIEISGEAIRADQWYMVDLRSGDEPLLPGSIRLDSNQVLDIHNEWSTNQKVLVICNRGISSRMLALKLRKLGHNMVFSLSGGAQGQHFASLMARFGVSE